MDKQQLDLKVEQRTKSTLAGMQIAMTQWPEILTPQQISDKADADWQSMLAVYPNIAEMLPRDTWIEYAIQGYAWQCARLMDMWGYHNTKLAQALLLGED